MSENVTHCMTVHHTVLEAFEKRTGFIGIGHFYAEKGLLHIIGGDTCEE